MTDAPRPTPRQPEGDERDKSPSQPKAGFRFKVGDPVRKVRGYSWPGRVVSTFKTLSGARRVVVECTVPEVAGALHIYNEDQLERTGQ